MRILVLFCLLLLQSVTAQAAEINAGFVEGLWYSDTQIFANQTTRVYVAVRNNTEYDLTGRVDFFDNGERFARETVSVRSGQIVETWTDWTPSYGEHSLQTNLVNTKLDVIGGLDKDADVSISLASDTIFIDYDTDGDGVGNQEDEDDDGDGVGDETEKQKGTDPLIFDEKNKTNSEEDESTESETTEADSVSETPPAGLEQFFTENRAGNTLSSVTGVINTSKARLDSYRQTRAVEDNVLASETINKSAAENIETPSDSRAAEAVSEDGEAEAGDHIGEITRSLDSKDGVIIKTWNQFWSALSGVVNYMFDLILLGLSKFLAHPIIVQITLLLLILFLIFKLANRFSRREY